MIGRANGKKLSDQHRAVIDILSEGIERPWYKGDIKISALIRRDTLGNDEATIVREHLFETPLRVTLTRSEIRVSTEDAFGISREVAKLQGVMIDHLDSMPVSPFRFEMYKADPWQKHSKDLMVAALRSIAHHIRVNPENYVSASEKG